MTRILILGFEPFGGETVNPSHEAGSRLAAESFAGATLAYRRVPVSRARAVPLALETVARFRPDAVIALGQANGRARITPERIAINVDDFRMPDNDGMLARDEPQVPGGPPAYLCTLPVRAMVETMIAEGVPAAVSNTAGTFLCNHLAFGLLHAVATQGLATRAGFVHLPLLPEQAATKPVEVPSMALDTMLRGLRAAVVTLIEACQADEAPPRPMVMAATE